MQTFEFIVVRGDSLTIELGPVTTEDKDGNHDPVDLTALDHLRLSVRTDPDAADALVELDEAHGITIDMPSTSEKNYATAFIPLDTFEGDAFAQETELVWDAELEKSTRRETFAGGKIIVTPDVTRAA